MTIKDTLQEIDNIAQEYSVYDYGLPIHSEGTLNDMENEIRKLIEFHVKAALEIATYIVDEAEGINFGIPDCYPLENIK